MVLGLGTFRFDANLGKRFQVAEPESVQVRFDALNVMNQPQPSNPDLMIDPVIGTVNPFGQIASISGRGSLY
jgi:hypothetical protein